MDQAETMSNQPQYARKQRNFRSAFTLVEVLIALIILSLGLLSVLGLVLAGSREGKAAMALATAYSTARSVLYDPAILDAAGYVNGYYAVRTIEETAVTSGVTIDLVRVRVYWGENGAELAGLTSYIRR